MHLNMLKSKIHRAVVTQADLNYVGSITIDKTLMEAAKILEYEKVEIANINNGERFATYVIAGEPGSGIICLNGAAARCADTGDKIIIMCYCTITSDEAAKLKPKVVFVNDNNAITKVAKYERHGMIE